MDHSRCGICTKYERAGALHDKAVKKITEKLSHKEYTKAIMREAKQAYKDRESHHGYVHVCEVLRNALRYFEHVSAEHEATMFNEEHLYVLIAAALFHDLWDRKFVTPEEATKIKKTTQDMLEQLFKKYCPIVGRFDHADANAMTAILIIDNISWSKMINGELNPVFDVNKPFSKPSDETWRLIHQCISDADMIAATGAAGWHRCVHYTKTQKHPPGTSDKIIMDDVLQHCRDKLLGLGSCCNTHIGRFDGIAATAELQALYDAAMRKNATD